MKKKFVVAGLLLAGILGFAGTCTIKNISLTKIGSNDVFAGEIHNDSGVNILGHNVLVAFLNSSGEVLETKTVTPCLRTLQNGSVDYFSSKSSKPAADTTVGLARLTFDSTFKVGTADTGDVTFSNVKVTRKDDTTLIVTGSIKNTDSTTLEAPTVCIVVYTSGDLVIVVAKDESLSDLSDNESDTFDIEVTVPDSTSLVDHVDIKVDGLHGDTPVAPMEDNGNDVTVCDSTSTPTPTGTATATATPVTSTATPTGSATPTKTATPVCS